MSNTLRIMLIIFSLLLFIIILNFISKKKIPIRYSLIWMLSALVIFFVGVFPNFCSSITTLIGFQATSNFVIGIILTLLLIITLILTMIVSTQKRKIKLLIQEVSILKKIVYEGNKNEKGNR